MGLKGISYDVKRIHWPIKTKTIILQLKNLIAFLQEAHLPDSEHFKFNKTWDNEVLFSSRSSERRRGAAILIHRSTQFVLHKEVQDTGRCILLNGSIEGVKVAMFNVLVYAPNEDIPEFIKNIFDLISDKVKGLF